ncbi:hypothetical protein [Chroococcidiopsis thermalis]|uniref:hypothetical protein n=1 Tax=Chroococcidiopsis thermalis TaxID=54299 RepID=UPI0002DC65D2|nr:hypothetical protein [Chroococcidiopsis thermalis]
MPDPHSTASIFWLLPAILLLLYALAAIGVFLLRGKGAQGDKGDKEDKEDKGDKGDKGTPRPKGVGIRGRRGTRGTRGTRKTGGTRENNYQQMTIINFPKKFSAPIHLICYGYMDIW